MAENESHFCMAVGPHAGRRNTRAAAVRSLLWANGQTITVQFLGGSEQLRARVRSVAAEWTAPDTANLRFAFVERGRADIRISFVAGNGSWSYIGTVARQVDQTEPTMNYGWLAEIRLTTSCAGWCCTSSVTHLA